jgi:transketolase
MSVAPIDPLQKTLERDMANALRALAMDAVQKANSGHPGMPMGMAEIALALWTGFLSHNPANPRWPDRDRFVLSNGHGSTGRCSSTRCCTSPATISRCASW